MTRTIESKLIPDLKTVIPGLMKACAGWPAPRLTSAPLRPDDGHRSDGQPATRLAHPHVYRYYGPARLLEGERLYFSHEQHAAMWSEITGADRKLVCDIRPMKPKRPGDLATALSEIWAPAEAAGRGDQDRRGLLRRSVDPGRCTAMKGRRLYAFGGVLRSMTQDFVELNAETVDGSGRSPPSIWPS